MELRYHTPLTPAEQLAHGLDSPQTLALADRVRFSELDTQNHVNNKAYITWFETVRIAHNERFCFPHYPGPRPRFLLHSISLRYFREMLQDEDYICTARVTAFRTSSYTLDQQIWSGSTLRARMSAVLVLGQPDGNGRYPLPETLKAAFRDRDGATDETA